MSAEPLTFELALQLLREDNPRAGEDVLRIYTAALRDFAAAEENIAKHGTIVFHPRTGAPIENPFLRVRAGAQTSILRCKLRRTDRVWGRPWVTSEPNA